MIVKCKNCGKETSDLLSLCVKCKMPLISFNCCIISDKNSCKIPPSYEGEADSIKWVTILPTEEHIYSFIYSYIKANKKDPSLEEMNSFIKEYSHRVILISKHLVGNRFYYSILNPETEIIEDVPSERVMESVYE